MAEKRVSPRLTSEVGGFVQKVLHIAFPNKMMRADEVCKDIEIFRSNKEIVSGACVTIPIRGIVSISELRKGLMGGFQDTEGASAD